MVENVTALFGGPSNTREPDENCISILEKWLEMARSGEIIGVAMSARTYDGAACFSVAGRVGGYSMLGALERAKADLIEFDRKE